MFLHIMVSQNSKKSNTKETTFFFSYDVMLKIYFCVKKYVTPVRNYCTPSPLKYALT